MSISLNVLAQPAINTSELIAWAAAAKPPFMVIMDEIEVGRRVQMASPTTQIVFRRYRPDDHKLPETTTPAAFLDSVADVPASYIVQAGNEPGGDQARLVDWTVELLLLATQRGRRVAAGNWSTGNPDDQAVMNGWYDPILTTIAGTKHLLSCHEYFHDKPAQEPYFVGRYRHFLRRAAELGIARPKVLITEHGRDLGGGADGWRAQGWSEADYARRLEEAQQVYSVDGVCACVFSFGAGFEQRWQTYNVEGARELLARMAAMNAAEGTDDMAGPPGWVQVTTKQAGANVRVRAAPGLAANTLTTIKTGDWAAKLPGATVQKDGYNWQLVAVQKDAVTHVHGFVALEVIQI